MPPVSDHVVVAVGVGCVSFSWGVGSSPLVSSSSMSKLSQKAFSLNPTLSSSGALQVETWFVLFSLKTNLWKMALWSNALGRRVDVMCRLMLSCAWKMREVISLYMVSKLSVGCDIGTCGWGWGRACWSDSKRWSSTGCIPWRWIACWGAPVVEGCWWIGFAKIWMPSRWTLWLSRVGKASPRS